MCMQGGSGNHQFSPFLLWQINWPWWFPYVRRATRRLLKVPIEACTRGSSKYISSYYLSGLLTHLISSYHIATTFRHIYHWTTFIHKVIIFCQIQNLSITPTIASHQLHSKVCGYVGVSPCESVCVCLCLCVCVFLSVWVSVRVCEWVWSSSIFLWVIIGVARSMTTLGRIPTASKERTQYAIMY